MAFGQSSGPPASHRQVQELLELLHDAGHTDFRDARGPMGFTQRQAGGKFTVAEAASFIEQLQESAMAGEGGGPEAAPAPPKPKPKPKPVPMRPTSSGRALQRVPAEELAAELQRRGWVVLEP